MKNIAKVVAAAAVAVPLIAGSAAAQSVAEEYDLTIEQQTAVDLVRTYNLCVFEEDTPERQAQIDAYDEAVANAVAEREREYQEWDKESSTYYEHFHRIAKEHGITNYVGVPGDYPELSTQVGFAEVAAKQARIHALVEQETGLTLPEYPKSERERLKEIDEPQRAVDLCSDRLSPAFEAAGIDIDWDLNGILRGVIQEHGPDAYEDMVTPSAAAPTLRP